jgi:hypothetical protein
MLVRLNEFACCSRTDSPFTHQRSRQRIVASFRLGRAPRFALRLTVIARREMRPNRLLPPNTFSTTSTRASWIPDVRVTRLSPRADRGNERFTTLDSLRRAVRLCFVRGRFLPQAFPSLRSGHEPSDRTSGTSVASPSLIDGASARIDRHQGRQDCIHRASVKITRCPQPEMPSIDR